MPGILLFNLTPRGCKIPYKFFRKMLALSQRVVGLETGGETEALRFPKATVATLMLLGMISYGKSMQSYLHRDTVEYIGLANIILLTHYTYYLSGLNGICISDHRQKGTCKETIIKLIYSTHGVTV